MTALGLVDRPKHATDKNREEEGASVLYNDRHDAANDHQCHPPDGFVVFTTSGYGCM